MFEETRDRCVETFHQSVAPARDAPRDCCTTAAATLSILPAWNATYDIRQNLYNYNYGTY
jgi:hypothetical protein